MISVGGESGKIEGAQVLVARCKSPGLGIGLRFDRNLNRWALCIMDIKRVKWYRHPRSKGVD
jgi:hypothetical protein